MKQLLGGRFWFLLGMCGLFVVLFDRSEYHTVTVPVEELSATAPEWTCRWRLPAAALPFLPPERSRWVNNSSLLWIDGQLLPLDRTGNGLPESVQRTWGEHRLEGDELYFMLPERFRGQSLKQIELAVNRGVHSRRAWGMSLTVLLFLLAAWQARREETALFTAALFGLAGLAPLLLMVGYGITPGNAIPEPWQRTPLGLAALRLESLGPGLLVLAGICLAVVNRPRGERPDDAASPVSVEAFQQVETRFVRWGWLVAISLLFFSWIRICSWGLDIRNDWVFGLSNTPFYASATYSDGNAYALGASRLRYRETLDQFNQRRPVNVSYYTGLLTVAGDDWWRARWIQGVLLALATGLVARQVTLTYGLAAGVSCLGFLWGVSRAFLLVTGSESLGYLLGCAGTIYLLRGFQTRALGDFLAGLAFLSLAQSSRPGALFVLPLLCLAIGALPTGWNRKVRWSGLAAGVMLAGLSLNSALLSLIGTGENVSGANFS